MGAPALASPLVQVGADAIIAALEGLAAAIAAMTLGELLLVLAVIVALVLLILALLRNAGGRPIDIPTE